MYYLSMAITACSHDSARRYKKMESNAPVEELQVASLAKRPLPNLWNSGQISQSQLWNILQQKRLRFKFCAHSNLDSSWIQLQRCPYSAWCLSTLLNPPPLSSLSNKMENAYSCSTEEVLNNFSVTETDGLSDTQVKKSVEKYGRNGKHLETIPVPKADKICRNRWRPSDASLGAYTRAIQGPARTYPAWFCSRIVRASSIRRRWWLGGFCGPSSCEL